MCVLMCMHMCVPPEKAPLYLCLRPICTLGRRGQVSEDPQSSAPRIRRAVHAYEKLSKEFPITTGVQHGDVLAPIYSLQLLRCSHLHDLGTLPA